MSNFFGGPSGPTQLDMTKMESEVLTDMFAKMANACFKKCTATYKENDLQVGEMMCVDRCSSKYMQAQEKVIKLVDEFGQKQAAMQNSAQAFKG